MNEIVEELEEDEESIADIVEEQQSYIYEEDRVNNSEQSFRQADLDNFDKEQSGNEQFPFLDRNLILSKFLP